MCEYRHYINTEGRAKVRIHISKIIPQKYYPVFAQKLITQDSASPKPHPSKPHPSNMPPAKTEVALQFSECCAAEVALQHWLFCSAHVILTKSCAAASENLQCNIEKAALQESGAFLPLSCGFQAPTFGHPRLGPAERFFSCMYRFCAGG